MYEKFDVATKHVKFKRFVYANVLDVEVLVEKVCLEQKVAAVERFECSKKCLKNSFRYLR